MTWLVSGIVAGAVAGALDAIVAIIGGIGGMSVWKAIRLIFLGASLLAFAGGMAGLVVEAGARLARRTRSPERWTAAVWALAIAPLVINDAFALFAGPQAAKVPGHALISLALAIVGVAGVHQAARLYPRVLAASPRALFWTLGVAALGALVVNKWVLSRLYEWFHTTLSFVTLAFLLLGFRAIVRPIGDRRRLLALIGLTVAGSVGAIFQLRNSQVMRYAAHERTVMTALALRPVPTTLQSRTLAAAERRAAEADLPPLPDGPRRPDADVVLITVDALRADHVGAYGYRRPTTPNIDALAAEGVRFSRAYTQAPHTSFSVASMLTGKYFPTLARLAPGERHDTIASVLRTYGWRTGGFYPPSVFYVDAQKLKTYSETHFNFEYVKFEYLDAEKRVDQILAYYAEIKPKRSFVWVHLFEPHEPYEQHPEWSFGAGDVDRYDSEIAYADAAIGRLVKGVRARRPGTIVVVTADHGEEFDEHGGRYHGSALFDEQVRVPLIISIPGGKPHVVEGQVELIDITPTILNLLDIPVPARMRGTDLGPWLASPPAPAARLPPAYAEVEDKRMVVYRNEKLLCDLHWGFCAYHDLAIDPREQRNLAEERPDRAAAMRALLDDWLDGHMRLEPLLAKGASNPEGGPLPKAIERGRLGDLLAAGDLAALMNSDAPASQRREAAALLVSLPPRREIAEALERGAANPDRVVGDWASVGAVRLGSTAARPRVQAITAAATTEPNLRVRAALALASVGDPTGVPVLGEALEQCEDILLCRLIIINLGKLRDRRAVPVLLKHLNEVQNRREMVDALGDIGDPSASAALLERLRADEYVPVRVQAAHALAKIGDRHLVPLIEKATRHETEPTVLSATKSATTTLISKPN